MNEELYIKHKTYYLNKKEKFKKMSFLAANTSAHIILAPLYVISISKQLSVTEHKNIYYDFLGTSEDKTEKISFSKKIQMLLFKNNNNENIKVKQNELTDLSKSKDSKIDKINPNKNLNVVESKNKAIQNLEAKYGALMNNEGNTKINKIQHPITIRDHINKNLVEASGVPEGQTPYRAAIFDNYKQMFKSYNKQGILSFWKGTLMRIVYVSSSLIFSGYIFDGLNFFVKRFKNDFSSSIDIVNRFISLTLAEIIFHPFFLLENRYVLQNRLPHFRVYQSYFTIKSRAVSDLYNFCHVHIYKNIFILISILSLNSIFSNASLNNKIILSVISSFFSYPLYTVIRRLVCQDIKTAGMIPNRYYNLLHGLALIKKEEGFKNGLYKGFVPFALAHIIHLNYIAITADHLNYHYFIPRLNPFINDESINSLLLKEEDKCNS